MAKMTGPVLFTGTIGEFSAYKVEGIEGIIARAKGGPSRHKVKNSPNFENPRRNNREFSGVNEVVDAIKRTIWLIHCFRDYNYTPPLNGICLDLQKLDAHHAWGERAYMFSLYGHLLEGFSFTKKHYFSTVVRPSLHCNIDRSSGSATIEIPLLIPGVNLFLPWQLPCFRFVISIGTVSDFYLKDGRYKEATPHTCPIGDILETEWFYANDRFKAQNFKVSVRKEDIIDENKTIIVSIAIQAGSGNYTDNLTASGRIRTACAKILKTG